MPLTFGVVGYSTRALAEALHDLGHRVIAIDAFGDQDLLDIAEQVWVVEDWPSGIASCIPNCDVDGWLLAGGMENCVDMVERLHAHRPVLGPSCDELKTLRSIEFWSDVCGGKSDGLTGLRTRPTQMSTVAWPQTTWACPKPSDSSRWLLKSLCGAGGLGVRDASARDYASDADDAGEGHPNCYWQRRIDGRVLGVTWVMAGASCQMLGITQSLQAHEWPGPTEFIYRGSIGPIELTVDQHMALESLGQRISQRVPNYRGYLQADLIEDAAHQLWLLELNPRWTSGMEILHIAASRSAASPLAMHLKAWGIGPDELGDPIGNQWRVVSKAIVYANRGLDLSQSTRRNLTKLRDWQSQDKQGVEWSLADLPPVACATPMRFEAGSPILTLRCRVPLSRQSENLR